MIELNKDDRDYLCQVLEKSQKQQDKWYRYQLDSQKYAEIKYEIYEDTMKDMQSDASSESFSFNVYNYTYLLKVLKDLDIHRIDVQKAFVILRNMTVASFGWTQSHGSYEAWNRIEQGYSIAVGLLLLQDKSGTAFTSEEQKEICSYFNEIKKEYRHSIAIDRSSILGKR